MEGSFSARWLTSLVPVKRYHHVTKSDLRKKTSQKTLKFSDCRKSIRKHSRPSCRKIFRVRFVFVWLRESSEIQRIARIFGLHSKCLVKELPPLSNFIRKAKIFLQSAEKPRYEFIAAVLRSTCISSGFLCSKVA